MFKIPEWEDDIPKNNISFSKNKPNKQNAASKQAKSPPKNATNGFPKSKQNNMKQSVIKTKNNDLNVRKENNRKARKRKLNVDKNVDIQNVDPDKIDEVLLNAKKKKFNEALKKEDVEQDLFTEQKDSPKKNKKEPRAKLIIKKNRTEVRQNKNVKAKQNIKNIKQIIDKKIFHVPSNTDNDSDTDKINNNFKESNNKSTKIKNNSDKDNIVDENNSNQEQNVNKSKKKEPILKEPVHKKKDKLKKLLQTNRNSISVNSDKLRVRMLDRLKAAQFRYLNEKLYTSSGNEAKQLFQSDPAAFHTYHQGYQQQIKKWPVNPLDLIVKRIMKMPKTHLVADLGCGEAALSRRVPQTVRSFDLVQSTPDVEVCDMAHTPLPSQAVHVAVYCLALMGTELTQYLVEANRILKMNGHLLIAEVESRFDNVDNFTKDVQQLGFKLKNLDKSHKVFFFMEFVKVRDPPVKKSKLPAMTLKPCLYKKR